MFAARAMDLRIPVFTVVLLLLAGRAYSNAAANDAMDMANNMMNNAMDMANMSSTEMRKLIKKNTGFDAVGLPKNLMQTASTLFQMHNTSVMTNIFQEIHASHNDTDMDTMHKNFLKLLTWKSFVTKAKALMATHVGKENTPEFKEAMRKLLVSYFKNMGGGASRYEMSLIVVLVLAIVPFLYK